MAKILLIDDEELVREAMRVALELENHQVVEAANGEEGIIQQTNNSFDVIITDILMPVKEGIETIIQLKQGFPDLKIIAVSGGARSKDIDYLKLAKDFGANEILSKPFSNEELVDCVNRVLS